ncbi:MAG: OmpA family protein, partial [Endomicrobiia bacterium]
MCKKIILLLFLLYINISLSVFADIFYVFSPSPKEKNFYSPTGYMGDVSDINLSASNEVLTVDNYPSLKLRYKPKGIQKWIGVYFQNPPTNWGQYKGGYDLTGAEKLVFYAKGENGGEIITSVGVGGIKGKYPDSDIYQTGPVKLTREWKKYTIDLYGLDLSYISGGFFFIIETKDNPLGCTIYFGDIYYEGKKIKSSVLFADKKPPQVSLSLLQRQVEVEYDSEGVAKEVKIEIQIFCDDDVGVDVWSLEIFSPQQNIIKKFSGNGKVNKTLIWDGLDDVYTKVVPEGVYRVVLKATDSAGNSSSKEDSLNIIHKKPQPQKVVEVKEIIKEVPKEVKITEDEKSLRVQLQSSLLFETGKWELLPQSRNTLLNVVELLKQYPKNKIVVEGHTDSVGSDE